VRVLIVLNLAKGASIVTPTFALSGARKRAKRRFRASVFERVVRRHHFHQSGYATNVGAASEHAHSARDSQKIRAWGEIDGSSSRDPAGTTTVRPLRV